MNTDNGVYFAEFNDGWRVAFTKIRENVFISPHDASLYFQYSLLFKTEGQALDYANKLYCELVREFIPVKYGLLNLGHLGKFNAKTGKHRRIAKTNEEK